MAPRLLVRTLSGILGGAAIVGLVLGAAAPASAHPVGTSGLYLAVHESEVLAELQVSAARLATATGIESDGAEGLLGRAADIESYVADRLRIADADGELALAFGEPRIEDVHEKPSIVVDIVARPADGVVDGAVSVTSTVLTDRMPDHRVYVALISDWTGGHVVEGEPAVVAVLDGTRSDVVLDRAGASWWTGFGATLVLGMQHIAEGTDHMLFLIVLLLSAPLVAARARVGWRWDGVRRIPSTIGRTALIVTAFTVGHTVTLALVSLGLVTLPTKPVEVLVALSIAIAAVHAIKPLLPRGEILVAGVFGLVHGTAFATTILDLQLSGPATVAAIVGFNVGVELAQLIVVALALPLVILLSRTRVARPVRLVLASLAVIAAAAWVVAILTDSDSVLTPVFAAIAAHPIPYYAVAVAATIAVWALARQPRPIEEAR